MASPQHPISPALRALMRELIDHAGLFPPAELPMADAVAIYTERSSSGDAWMLGRFICPLARLQEAERAFASAPGSDMTPIAISGLLPTAPDVASFLEAVAAALQSTAKREASSKGKLRVEALEGKIPGDISAPAIERLATHLRRNARAALGRATPVFLEASPSSAVEADRWAGGLAAAGAGAKLRCGGATIPSPRQVAEALIAARTHSIPFKATAGLHHPLPGRGGEHGFLNLFVGGILDRVHRFEPARLEALLRDDRLQAFQFDGTGLRWERWGATTDQVRALRPLITSFGSCSFDEPREDLRAMDLLGP